MLRSLRIARVALITIILVVLSATLSDPTVSRATSTTPVSTDPYANTTSQHNTEVEPDTFAFGATVVSAFQVGRFFDGGASNIGWATSFDSGATWTNGFLPSLTTFSTPPGTAARASDPSVAYDAVHGTWLIVSLTLTSAGDPIGVVVSRSADAVAWSAPVIVALGSSYDKEWVVCDSGAASPFRGRCYVSWDDFGAGNVLLTSTSLDGGQTWSAPVGASGGVVGLGTQPLVQPNGTLIIPAENPFAPSMISIRSTNGGASFSAATPISSVSRHNTTAMRAGSLPSAQIDQSGTVYVSWHDCRFRASCAANDIVYSRSADGVTWSAVARVPIDPVASSIDHFIPGLAVDAASSGATTRLGLVYYYFTDAACVASACQLNVGFISSNDAGGTWSVPKQLNPSAMSVSWLPDTNQGRMVGDYIAAAFSNGVIVSVFPLATPPSGSTFNQAMYADREGTAVPPPPDSDGDGCPDVRETGPDYRTGGQRDPNNPYDFFDVPVPALLPSNTTGTRNKAIALNDVLAIVAYVGTSAGHATTPNGNGAKYGSDLNANGTADGREYDRTPSTTAGEPWRSEAPNGAVSLQDALVALNQVGTNCN